MHTDIKGLN